MDYIRNNKKLLFIMAGVLLAGCLLFYWLRPASVAALTVTEQEYIPSLLLSGEVIAEGSTLLSSLSTGKVVACPVTKGESVKKGQLLVQIDDTQARIERERAASAVRTAAAQLEKAQTVTLNKPVPPASRQIWPWKQPSAIMSRPKLWLRREPSVRPNWNKPSAI
jgi:HlyD family secretion protein